MTNEEIQKLFQEDYKKHALLAAQGPNFNLVNEIAKRAFIDLTYNQGVWWKKYPKAGAAAAKADWEKTAEELKNSNWYKQLQKQGRSVDIVNKIKNAGKRFNKAELDDIENGTVIPQKMKIASTDNGSTSVNVMNNTTNIRKPQTIYKVDNPKPSEKSALLQQQYSG
jgi:hypothetical protein